MNRVDSENFDGLYSILTDIAKGRYEVDFSNLTSKEKPEYVRKTSSILQNVVNHFRSKIESLETSIHKLEEMCDKLSDENRLLEEHFRERARALEKTNALLESISTTDALTGISNRRSFDYQLKIEVARSERYNSTLSCIMLDIDFFKNVNDTHGHNFGDEVLREIGRILRVSLRKHDFCARYGGEEFVILLPETKHKEAYRVAEKLRELISRTTVTEGEISVNVTISLGVAELDLDKMKEETDLVEAADKALYKAKRSGRNRSIVYSTEDEMGNTT